MQKRKSDPILQFRKDLAQNTSKMQTRLIDNIINIDSRHRDPVKYTLSNSFRVNLNRDYRQVVEAELLTAEIPNTDYNVTSTNNVFQIRQSSTTYTITLTVGDYDASELSGEIANQINTVIGGSSYSCSIIEGLCRVQRSGAGTSFELLFSSGASADAIVTNATSNDSYIRHTVSSRQVMGFEIADYSSSVVSGNQTITSPNKIDLFGHKYLIIDLAFNGQNLQDISNDLQAFNAFARIQMDAGLNVMKYYNVNHEYNMKRTYSPPLNKINRVFVKTRCPDGTLYNYRGHDMSLMIRLTCLGQ